MEDTPSSASAVMPYAHLEELLKQNLDLAKENHKILKRMERNAIIGFIARAIIWLIVLGVPIFFLSTYLAPLMQSFQKNGTAPSGFLGLPSAQQLQQILNQYRASK